MRGFRDSARDALDHRTDRRAMATGEYADAFATSCHRA